MKKSFLFLLLLAGILSTQSSVAGNPNAKSAAIVAKIDGCNFNLKESKKYSARTSGESNTTVLTFNGADVKDKDGKLHAQKINVEYALADGKPIIVGVSFEFNEQTFYSLPGETS